MLRTLHLSLLLGVAWMGISNAQNLNSSTCSSQCELLATTASSWESTQHADPEYSFYNAPSNFSADLPPGRLLRVEHDTNLSAYNVPSGLTMSRIIYTTADLNGRILPASAYILWPYAPLATPKLKNKQFPLVAWAHGTSGVLGACAPSNYRNLQYNFMVPYLLALQGMAVVAPDYAGLGVSTLPSGEHIGHPWISGPSQAGDLANAILAARSGFPTQLPPDGPFVAIGHSQGGLASWAFSERMVDKPIAGYKGTVSIAPPTNTFKLLEQQLADLSTPLSQALLGQQPSIISGITALFPSYNYSGLTDLAYDRWHNVMVPLQGCLPTHILVYSDVPVANISKPNWIEDPVVQKYAQSSDAGRKKFKGPLLVLAGETDAVVPLFGINSTVDETCKMLADEKWHESLEMITYMDMDHFPVIQASSMKWLPWIKERLTGKPVERPGCAKSIVEGYRTDHTYQSTSPNFFVGWLEPQEAWKYSL